MNKGQAEEKVGLLSDLEARNIHLNVYIFFFSNLPTFHHLLGFQIPQSTQQRPFSGNFLEELFHDPSYPQNFSGTQFQTAERM